MARIREHLNPSIAIPRHLEAEAGLHSLGLLLHDEWVESLGLRFGDLQHAEIEEEFVSECNALQVCCLVYLLMYGERFDVPTMSGITPTFLVQRRRFKEFAKGWLSEIIAAGGTDGVGRLTWVCWTDMEAEMNDRLSHSDDVLSPIRAVIQMAHALPPRFNDSPANIHDRRFRQQLRDFYDGAVGDIPATGSIHPWSNIAEGTFYYTTRTGHAQYPGSYATNLPRSQDVMLARRSRPSSLMEPDSDESSRPVPVNNRIAVMETVGGIIEEIIFSAPDRERLQFLSSNLGAQLGMDSWIGRLGAK